MKLAKLIIAVVIISINTIANSQNLKNESDDYYNNILLTSRELGTLTDNISRDEKLMLERLTAYFFHNFINEYRLLSNKEWLFWNEDLWLAAHNHNVYLLHEDNLSHYQKNKNEYFSGYSVNNRICYVNGTEVVTGGENIFRGNSWDYQITMIETAKGIAKLSLDSWKTSPGHNANMLNSTYNNHGTSFIIVGDQVYATTAFQGTEGFRVNEITITWDDDLAKQNTPRFLVKNKEVYSSIDEIDLNKRVFDMIKRELLKSTCVNDNNMNIAAQKHAQYMNENNNQSSYQKIGDKKYYAKTPKKRYIISAGGITWFHMIFTKVYDKSILLKYPLKDFIEPEKVFADIEKKISKFLPKTTMIEKWGAAVEFCKKQNEYHCVINFTYTLK